MMFARYFRSGVAVALLAAASASPAQVVISQVYGGAGCGTAGCSAYKNDYIEIFNLGSAAANVNGWSVQYGSSGGTTWTATALPNVSIPAGGYLLIAEGGNANGTSDLPTPDVSASINMSG
jgi:predicted extracellular nuclease